ncbi:hypothetical protein BBM40_04105 [Vibrio parahaemolyticus]|nr:hypothetical protein ACZ92_00225 [Vibrio parahaemolyticus]ODZ56280.1 hypothetical protein BBM40_04105 [Vibrio parahaemolyticus]
MRFHHSTLFFDFFLKRGCQENSSPYNAPPLSGQSGNAKAAGNKAKKLLKINFKKCLTLRISSLEYASALREKLLEKQAL